MFSVTLGTLVSSRKTFFASIFSSSLNTKLMENARLNGICENNQQTQTPTQKQTPTQTPPTQIKLLKQNNNKNNNIKVPSHTTWQNYQTFMVLSTLSLTFKGSKH